MCWCADAVCFHGGVFLVNLMFYPLRWRVQRQLAALGFWFWPMCRPHVWVFFKPSNTLRQKLVHPKDRTPHTQKSNLAYAVQCSEECKDLYIGETKQPLNKRMAQHRRANRSGFSCLFTPKGKFTLLWGQQCAYLDREDRRFERGVKETICVKVEKPSLNRGGGLRHHLSPIYSAALSSPPRRFNNLTSKNNGRSQMTTLMTVVTVSSTTWATPRRPNNR